MRTPIYLSVIVPLHNETRRLERCLDQLLPEIKQYSYEVILMENGSTDGTAQLCNQCAFIYPGVRWLKIRERGKGFAVRTGMLAAHGRYRYMCDCDLSTPASEIHKFLEFARQYEVVIGSREKDRSTVRASMSRRVIGRVLHMAVDGLLTGITDTQCGFKMFRDYAAMRVFADARINGVAFDVEALQLARLNHLSIREIPVTWKHDGDSRMGAGDGIEFLLDVLSLYGRRVRNLAPAR